MIKIVNMADAVWRDLGSPPDNQIPYIATWFRTNIGNLNNLIATDFVIDRATQEIISRIWYRKIECLSAPACNTPPSCGAHYQCFKEDEADIYKELFKVNFYESRVNGLLYAAQFDTIVSVKEGDSEVTRKIVKNDLAKTFLALHKEAHDQLVYLSHLYKYNKSNAVQVTGDDFVTPAPFAAYLFDYGPGFYF